MKKGLKREPYIFKQISRKRLCHYVDLIGKKKEIDIAFQIGNI